MGPLVTREHRQKVLEYIDIGKREARLVVGGGTPRDSALAKGFFVEPTIFADVDNRARIAQEEIFGPVLSVIPFDSEADALRIANDTPYGLAGAVWTRDVFRGIRVLKQIRAGILWLNTYHPTYNEAPWGGYKQSGFGRELGPARSRPVPGDEADQPESVRSPDRLVLIGTNCAEALAEDDDVSGSRSGPRRPDTHSAVTFVQAQ
jgi:acyl-CoA reductase-like NAD-dependent aldehyde dehydrogenase